MTDLSISIRCSHLFASTALSLAILATAQPEMAHAQGSTEAGAAQHSFDIPAQPLGSALKRYAAIVGAQLFFNDADVAGRNAPAVKGRLSDEEAIRRLLAGSGLTWSKGAGNTIVVRPVRAEATLGPGELEAGRGLAEAASADQEIIVTGTRIPGATPASPVRSLKREEIERSGFASTGDLIRSLPQVSGSTFQPGASVSPFQSMNLSAASSADLRGLGPGATLSLLNGHRIAYNGVQNAVDISIIPLPAIERIDVLTDGASALYGSDAIAGVVNFILRDDFQGALSSARIGLPMRGGAAEAQLSQLAGQSWSSGNVVLSLNYLRQDELRSDERSFSDGLPDPTDLLPEQRQLTIFGVVNQDLTDWISAFLEGFYSDKEVKSRTSDNLIASRIRTSQNFTDTYQYGLTGGVKVRLSSRWQAELTASRSKNRENYLMQGNTSDDIGYYTDNTLTSVEAVASGSLFELPAGRLGVAIGGGYRREALVFDLDTPGRNDIGRTVKYAMGEIRLPAFHIDTTSLELSASARYEDYGDAGDVFNPKVGAVLSPVPGLHLRGTWGRSFRAPPLQQRFGGVSVIALPAASFGIPGVTPGDIGIYLAGANHELGPERSRSFTLGADLKPAAIPHLSVSATYFNVKYKDRIGPPLNTTVGIWDSPVAQEFIIKNPSSDIVDDIISSSDIVENYTGSPIDPSRVRGIFLSNLTNISRQNIRGIDANISYTFDTNIGSIQASGDISWLDIDQRNTSNSPWYQISGRVFRPSEWKGRTGLSWTAQRWSASAAINYVGEFIDNSSEFIFGAVNNNRKIKSWKTFDFHISYMIDGSSSTRDASRISLTIRNAFDRSPPHIDAASSGRLLQGVGFDPTNADALGRVVAIAVTKRW